MKLRLTLEAEADLAHILDTITIENPTAAARVQRAIARSIELLRLFPHIGRIGTVEDTREKPVKALPYLIVYKDHDDELIVLRIFHGAQSRA